MFKDKIGLVLYIVIFVTIAILCPFLGLDILFDSLWEGITLNFLPTTYLITIPLVTHFAIKNNWSRYLNWYFDRIWLQIVVLIGLPCLISLNSKLPYYTGYEKVTLVLMMLIPAFFLVTSAVIFEMVSKHVSKEIKCFFINENIGRKKKDIIGFVLYFSLFATLVYLPCYLGFGFFVNNYTGFPTLAFIAVLLIACAKMTTKAIEENWSKYLNWFFSNSVLYGGLLVIWGVIIALTTSGVLDNIFDYPQIHSLRYSVKFYVIFAFCLVQFYAAVLKPFFGESYKQIKERFFKNRADS